MYKTFIMHTVCQKLPTKLQSLSIFQCTCTIFCKNKSYLVTLNVILDRSVSLSSRLLILIKDLRQNVFNLANIKVSCFMGKIEYSMSSRSWFYIIFKLCKICHLNWQIKNNPNYLITYTAVCTHLNFIKNRVTDPHEPTQADAKIKSLLFSEFELRKSFFLLTKLT